MTQLTRALFLFALLCLPACLRAADPTTPANVMTELTFTSAKAHPDPFNDLTLDAMFTDPSGKQLRVPAFWAGGNTWKIRYASPTAGVHPFVTECSDPADPGLHHVRGQVKVTPYKGDNPLYLHGPLRVAKGSRYIQHADGTPFLWLGDTWWMGLTTRLGWPDEFQTLAADRKRKGFNLIQIVAGLYPDMAAFDPRGDNEAGQPWEPKYARIRPEYFDAADKKILYLVEQGFTPCIVSTWGYHVDWLGAERMKQHQRYVYARWGALPIVWCIAGEVSLPYYKSPEFNQPWEKQTDKWRPIFKYCRSINCFDRLITAHPSSRGLAVTRDALKDDSLLDFDMLQTPHGQLEALAATVAAVRLSYNLNPPMPVVNAEPSYEMLFDRTPSEIARLMFWACWTNGIKGYTYGANGIWQVNGRTKPYGRSASGADYGQIRWDQAMNLVGSTYVSIGAKLLSRFRWQNFEPHPDWATYVPASDSLPFGAWIWFPEGDPAKDAPAAPRYFRRTIEIPAGAKVRSASLQLAADDLCIAYLNNDSIGSNNDWHNLRRIDNLASKLHPGRNVLAIRAENVDSRVPANPAGLTFGMTVILEEGKTISVHSDESTRSSRTETRDWQSPDFDDSKWPESRIAAPFGAQPWGPIDQPAGNPALIPYATGIPNQIRLIYVPQPRAIVLHGLEPGVDYQAFYFDPATGDQTDPSDLTSNTISPPSHGHDWVLILRARE